VCKGSTPPTVLTRARTNSSHEHSHVKKHDSFSVDFAQVWAGMERDPAILRGLIGPSNPGSAPRRTSSVSHGQTAGSTLSHPKKLPDLQVVGLGGNMKGTRHFWGTAPLALLMLVYGAVCSAATRRVGQPNTGCAKAQYSTITDAIKAPPSFGVCSKTT
jgi:hypothetical protein